MIALVIDAHKGGGRGSPVVREDGLTPWAQRKRWESVRNDGEVKEMIIGVGKNQ